MCANASASLIVNILMAESSPLATNTTNVNANPSNRFSFHRLFTNLEVLETLELELPSLMTLLTGQQSQMSAPNLHHIILEAVIPIVQLQGQILK